MTYAERHSIAAADCVCVSDGRAARHETRLVGNLSVSAALLTRKRLLAGRELADECERGRAQAPSRRRLQVDDDGDVDDARGRHT